jgi:hypothetical protein
LLLARVFRAMVVIQAPAFGANHRGLSRLPSRRQPFTSESANQHEKRNEESIKFALRTQVEILATPAADRWR